MLKYTIKKSEGDPFPIKFQELRGLYVLPIVGEEINWFSYELPQGRCYASGKVKVEGRAKVHGLEGLEIMETVRMEDGTSQFREIVQVTDSHERVLASSYIFYDYDGLSNTKEYTTILDKGYSLAELQENPEKGGSERTVAATGAIVGKGNEVWFARGFEGKDVVGAYEVTIGDKTYHTMCYMSIVNWEGKLNEIHENYIDQTGRTVLMRGFERNDWVLKDMQRQYGDNIPQEEILVVNGEVFIHSFDKVSEYVEEAKNKLEKYWK